jgi:hypothetical protein
MFLKRAKITTWGVGQKHPPLKNREAEPTRTWDERCGIAMLDPETGPLEHLIWVGSSRKQ